MLTINRFASIEFPSEEMAATTSTPVKILSFGDLEVGWHYGEGGPIDSQTITAALEIYWQFFLAEFDDTDAFPGVDGEIMVTAYRGNHYVEVIVENDGTMSLSYEFEDVEMFPPLEHRPAKEIKQKVAEVAREIWSTSAFYTMTTLTLGRSKIASKVWHSKTPPRMEEHLWFNDIVWTPQVPLSAIMQENIIRPK